MEKPIVSVHLREIPKNPAWFPIAFDWGKGTFEFAKTSRDKLSGLSFLDSRQEIGPKTGFSVSISEVLSETKPSKPPIFIFHTGFCCSTLLARCLDQKGVCLPLKEPGILNSFSATKPILDSGFMEKRYEKALEAALRLLGRRFSEAEAILIKASNFDTPLIPDIQKTCPAARLILIHQDLKTFLLSVAKGGAPRREFVKRLWAHYQTLTRKGPPYPALSIPKAPKEGFSDLHSAALVWHWQTALFGAFSGARAKTVLCSDFLGDPERELAQIRAFLKIAGHYKKADLQETLKRHAKAPEFSFSPEKRAQEMRTLEAYLAPVLPGILEWAEGIPPSGGKNQPVKMAG